MCPDCLNLREHAPGCKQARQPPRRDATSVAELFKGPAKATKTSHPTPKRHGGGKK